MAERQALQEEAELAPLLALSIEQKRMCDLAGEQRGPDRPG